MTSVLPFLIIGVVSGSIYGMAAVGLVLSYRTSGIFNFAHGALATLAAYVFYWLHYASRHAVAVRGAHLRRAAQRRIGTQPGTISRVFWRARV